MWPVAAVVFLSTMLTLAYAARLLEKMYFTPASALESPRPGAVATDGGERTDGHNTADAGAESIAADGGILVGSSSRGSPDSVSFGMLALLVSTAVLAVVLGFAGGTFADLLGPFVTEVFN